MQDHYQKIKIKISWLKYKLLKYDLKIIIGKSEKANEPILPDIVFFGLILVNFLPPIVLPIT